MATIIQKFRAEYNALVNAIHRCHNPNNIAYKRYGARGIKVSAEWRNLATGFPAFLKHLGPRPGSKYSLDRINNHGNYEPGNVRWTDRKTQQNNIRKKCRNVTDLGWGIGYSKLRGHGRGIGRRLSALVPFDGRVQTVADWAEELGIKRATIRQRLEQGLTPEQAMDPKLNYGARNKPMGEQPVAAPHLDPDHLALMRTLDRAVAALTKAMDQLGKTLH